MNTIHITVEGGVIQSIDDIPPDVQVVVHDYDIEGCEDIGHLKPGPDGEECMESIWVAADKD